MTHSINARITRSGEEGRKAYPKYEPPRSGNALETMQSVPGSPCQSGGTWYSKLGGGVVRTRSRCTGGAPRATRLKSWPPNFKKQSARGRRGR